LEIVEFAYSNKIHTGTKVLFFKADSRQDHRVGFKLRKWKRHRKAEKLVIEIKKVQKEMKTVL